MYFPPQSSHIKQHVPAFAHQRSGFLRAMSDAGLKPTVVHHNLTPAELYEQVRPALTDSNDKSQAPSKPHLDFRPLLTQFHACSALRAGLQSAA